MRAYKLIIVVLILVHCNKYKKSSKLPFQVKNFYGNTKIYHKDNTAQSLNVGDYLRVNDSLHAGGNTIIDIKYKKIYLRLVSNATVKVAALH